VDEVCLEWAVRRRAGGGGEDAVDVALDFWGDVFEVRGGGIPGAASDRRDVDEVGGGLGFCALDLGFGVAVAAAAAKERTEGPAEEAGAPASALEVDAPVRGERGGAEDGDGDGGVDALVVDPGVGVADGGVGGGGCGEGGFGVLDGVEGPDEDCAEFVGEVGEKVGARVLRLGGHG